MNRFSKLLLAATVSVSMTGIPAQAAELLGQLDNVTGSVLVQRDGGFFKAGTSNQLVAGDRVVAIDGASADINLGMGCSMSIDDANTVTIVAPVAGAPDVCDTVFDVARLEVTDPVHDLSVDALPLLGLSTLVTILGAAAIVAAVVVIDKPSSP